MRKILTVVFLLILLSVKAQTSFGIKGGMNIAQTTRDQMGARIANHFGVAVEFKVNGGQFAFQPELLYSEQGFAYTNKAIQQTKTNKYDYISVPVMFKYYLTECLNLQLGPQFSFNINTEEEYSFKKSSVSQEVYGLKTFDFGMNVGVGYKFGFGLDLGFRYNRGMTGIYMYDYNDVNQLPTQNSVLQISVGYFF